MTGPHLQVLAADGSELVGTAPEVPRAERLALAAWLDPLAMPQTDAIGILRSGLVRDPAMASRELARG